ncbi:MAG: four helix bundle protein [Bacteroidales bacterium]|nr:four helix bundle protein [Bacteroidales bacterium]
MKSHEDLQVWQMAIDLVTDLYKVTNDFPKSELYGLTNQIRRASVSIPSNIAEGSARNSTKEYIQFLYIALGSAAEVETQLLISKNLGYTNDTNLKVQIKNIKGKLINLIASLKKKLK